MEESQKEWKQQKKKKNSRKRTKMERKVKERERDLEGEVDDLKQIFHQLPTGTVVCSCVLWLNSFRIDASICVCVWRAWVSGCSCVAFSIFFSVLASRVWLLSRHRGGKLYTRSAPSCPGIGQKKKKKFGLVCFASIFCFQMFLHRCMSFLKIEVSVGISLLAMKTAVCYQIVFYFFFSLRALSGGTSGSSLPQRFLQIFQHLICVLRQCSFKET